MAVLIQLPGPQDSAFGSGCSDMYELLAILAQVEETLMGQMGSMIAIRQAWKRVTLTLVCKPAA